MPLVRLLFLLVACAALSACSGVPVQADKAAPLLAPRLEAAAPTPTVAPPAATPTMTRIQPPAAPLEPAVVASALDLRQELPPLPTIDLTTQPDDLWQRMRNGFGMVDLNSPLVADRQAWYLNRPEMLQRVFERSRKYLYHIVVELEKRGMPTELALLPVVESSFNPLAYSPARALGIWQFIPSTGKSYNLKQNWWLDERRDIVASTTAALDYLQTIYEMHGDWHLALASYNWGENAVARAIAKNQAAGLPTDYLSLTMPGETRYYVPKLQAIKNIIARPELFGVRLDPIANKAYFGTVDMTVNADIATVARLAETPLSEFMALNPAYQRPVIPGDSTSPLVIPADKLQIFRANLARHEAEDKPLSSWRTYVLKKNEKLESVAARFGLSAARLKQLNGITPRMKISPGQNFLIPLGGGQDHERVTAALPKPPVLPRTKIQGSKKAKKAAVTRRKAGTQPPAKAAVRPPANKAKAKPAAARKP